MESYVNQRCVKIHESIIANLAKGGEKNNQNAQIAVGKAGLAKSLSYTASCVAHLPWERLTLGKTYCT